MISVIIATKNRLSHITSCIQSILSNTYDDYELIIIDQSKNSILKKFLRSNKKIHYVYSKTTGKSTALNIGLSIAKGNIYTFTDDDCIVSQNWLEKINALLGRHPDIDGLFGSTLPFRAKAHKGYFCPATFSLSDSVSIYDIYHLHYNELGLGNNMSIRKETFHKNGFFKEWLGPGSSSLVAGGEDTEFIFRSLLQGARFEYSPKIRVYHDKWITPNQEKILHAKYTTGVVACYTYHALRNKEPYALTILFARIKELINLNPIIGVRTSLNIGTLHINIPILHSQNVLFLFYEGICYTKGILLGITQSIKDSK